MEMTIVDQYTELSEDYQRVEQAIRFLEQNYRRQPELKEVAESIHLSEYHFQRLFTRWVGISPKRFLQFLTKENAKAMLENSHGILEAAYNSGLSGPGRLHDLFVATEAVTPGEFKHKGAGLTIRYGFHPSPFGQCLVGVTGRGICHLSFVQPGGRSQALDELQKAWPEASLQEDPQATRPLISQIFTLSEQSGPLGLHLCGTNFQIKVWEALLRIPPGTVVSYEDLAVSVGMPHAARAVGHAVGSNPVPVLIPCHRVIRKTGEFGSYHYGAARKKALLGWEMAYSQV
jgi:AraC family transcriptional regulator, regulatory protein of adaptative response / methylated-DNA-[protein]-cysteine methyltransferase